MALIIDARAQAAVSRRQERGRDARLVLYIGATRARHRFRVLAVDWAARRQPDVPLVVCRIGEVRVCTERRIARYLVSHDLTISAWRIGPFALLWVASDLAGMLDLLAWERGQAQSQFSGRRATESSRRQHTGSGKMAYLALAGVLLISLGLVVLIWFILNNVRD